MRDEMYPKLSPTVRLERYSIPEPNSGCWPWLRGVDKNGYGILVVDGKSRKAHRVAYDLFVGAIGIR